MNGDDDDAIDQSNSQLAQNRRLRYVSFQGCKPESIATPPWLVSNLVLSMKSQLETNIKTTSTYKKAVQVSRDFVHNCLIHANDRKIDDSIRSGMIVGLEILRKIKSDKKYRPIKERCIFCAAGKIIRKPIYSTENKADRILRRIHTDTKELPCQSPNGDTMGQLVVDEFSKYRELIFFRKHSEVSTKLFEIIDKWEIEQHPNRVGEIRSDSTDDIGMDNKNFRELMLS